MGTSINEETTRAAVAWAARRLRWEQTLLDLHARAAATEITPVVTQGAPAAARGRRVRPRPAANEA